MMIDFTPTISRFTNKIANSRITSAVVIAGAAMVIVALAAEERWQRLRGKL